MAESSPSKWRRVKTPTVLQMEAAECGAAALGIILEFHGRYIPLDMLRDDCGVSRDGSNAFYIKEAAKRYGLEVKAGRKSAEGLRSWRPPFIVFWQWNHFLVVEGFGLGRVYLNDPASGRRTMGFDEFERGYSGIGFNFTPGPQFVKEGRRPSIFRGLARRLSKSKTAIVFVVLAGLALVIPSLVTAAYQRVFMDEILIQGHHNWLKPLLLAMAFTAILRVAAAALQQLYLTRLEVKLTLDESLKFLAHVLRLPLQFFQRRYTGDLVARVSSTARVSGLLSGELATTAVSLLTLVAYVAVMLPYEPLLAMVGVGISSLNLVALKLFSRWRTDQNRGIEQIRGRLVAGIMGAIQIVESIKATGSESEMLVRWTGEQARMINAEQTLGVYDALLFVIPPLLASLTTIVVLGLGGYQVVVGGLSIGVLLALQSLLAGFNQPFLDMARLGAEIQELRADLDRIDDVRNRPVDVVFESEGRITAVSGPGEVASEEASPHRLSGRVEFRGVTFGYNRTVEEPLIHDFSFVAAPGQRIALVGGSGSGKSTIGRLAAGLYQPWSGEILYDGQPMGLIPREVFVNSTLLVDSEICLFEGTVRDNLTLWDDFVPIARLTQAGVEAAIHRDLLQRRGGYGAAIGEAGRNFSGGQRQRLQIARALVREPSLLILDEATSALDPKTERIVDDNLRRRGCTCLIIAHRLTTIRDCDEIIVLNAGRVVQRGTHDELIAESSGEYSRLLSFQALPGARAGRLWGTRRSAAQALVPIQSRSDKIGNSVTAPLEPVSVPAAAREPDSPRFIVEELLPYSQPESTAANRPLSLDDPEAVWWVSSGGVDVFFTQCEPGAAQGNRRHLCRVEEGGSIFAISGVRGQSGSGLVAVGAGPAQLLKFARGDLIRLSFEEGLSEQVAVLIDDWLLRAGRALGRLAGIQGYRELEWDSCSDLDRGTRFGVRHGVGWVRHFIGSSSFLDQNPLPVSEVEARFPLSENLWLTTASECRVTACDTTTMIRTSDPWAGLDAFHRTMLDFISGIEAQESRTGRAEFLRSLENENALVESVKSQLAAAATQSAVSPVDPGGDALVTACRTVGQALGIEVRAPRAWGPGGPGPSSDLLGDLARTSGFHVRPVTLPPDWWRRAGGEPLLGQLADPGHLPVALIPAKAGARWGGAAYRVLDREGRSRPVDLGMAGRLDSTAWTLYRTLPDEPQRKFDLFRFSLSLPGLARELWIVFLMALFAAMLNLSIPVAAGILVDRVIPEADRDRSSLAVMCVFLVVLSFSAAICRAIQGLLVLRIEGRVSATMIPAVWDRLLRLPTGFFARFSSGDLAFRAMEFSKVFKKVSGAGVTTLVMGLFAVFNLGLLFVYSWKMALCTAFLLGIMIAVTGGLLAGLLRFETAIQRIDGVISGLLLELLGGIITLRTAGAERRAFARWAGRYTERLVLSIQARRFANRLHQWLAVYPILTAMVVYVGALYVDTGLMRTGSFLAFSIAFANLMAAVLAVGYSSMGLLDLLPTFERIRPILEERPEFAAAVIEPVRLSGAIALNHVSFRYPGQDQGTKVLDDVSLQVRPGEFVAIVGPSGAGKSTLMRLLLGFETPGAGSVTYDGRELTTLDLRDVRRQIGVVMQQAQLLPVDIVGNIIGFAPLLNIDDAWEAARLAGLDEDIRRMPMGMHTLVGEGGGNLSSGQRQRLLIARAIVRRPKILLLDEATSSLDNATQAIVGDSLTNQLRGITRVVIAHRLDVVVKADRIYVLTESRIVQSGPYRQLMEEPGPFRELARRQML
jgi:NHLM bacteriocin system ABC transporter peptidase/ATP-binding protein/NHLM bacteriocin system ABC transporter ATP-binding protein